MREAAAVAAASLLLLGACEAAEEPEQVVPDEVAPTDLGERPDVTAVLGEEPGEPPADLVVEEVVPGDGEEARPGDTLTVHHVGLAWSTQEEFDASWDRDQPLVLTLGEGRVIAGWEQGLEGMAVGGRRTLTIPPDLAYGDRGVENRIAPGETLIYVVDLLEIDR
jgi:peptidylprolyl isomerase